jgi:hypothetical protein
MAAFHSLLDTKAKRVAKVRMAICSLDQILKRANPLLHLTDNR